MENVWFKYRLAILYTASKKMVNEIIDAMDSELEVHDFRVVEDEGQVNLIFDLVVPFTYRIEEDDRLRKAINDVVKDKNTNCKCVIKVERGYM